MCTRIHVLLLALLLSVLLVACAEGDEEESIPLPDLTAFDAALSEQLGEIAAAAAEVRGLEPHPAIEQGTLESEQLLDYYEQAATEARLRNDINYGALNTTYRLLHMIGPDDDLLDLSEEGAFAILGFYAPAEDRLVLIADSPEQLALDDEATLAHEYVHSFQDEAFDLVRLGERAEKEERDKANTEYGDTLRALIEGDATTAQFQYVEEKVGPEGLRDWLSGGDEEADDEERDEEAGPEAFARYGAFPYSYGSAFVRYLYDDGGWDAVNDAYDDPPKTEEQILHPEKYLAGEEPAAISLRDLSEDLGEGWLQEMDALFGEFDVYNWIRSTLDNEFQATSAAAGWGGGRIAVYANELQPERVLVHIALIWDDTQEAREFFTTFGDTVRLIDAEPEILDPSSQIVAWTAENEVGHAWISRQTFQMVIGVRAEDVETTKLVIEAPATIPEYGYILNEPEPAARQAQPVRRLRDILPQAGELPPGFVLVQSGELGLQNPIISRNVDERYALFTDARSPDDGVIGTVSLERGALPGGILWSLLANEDRRLVFDEMTAQLTRGGNVTSLSPVNVNGIGEGALGAKAEFTPESGPRQLIKMIVFGRGAVFASVITFQDIDSPEMDIGRLARAMDDRLARYVP